MNVSWTSKKTEHQRNDVFVLWCWRRLLRVPWTARASNQSMRKEINTEYSLEGLMLKLKLQPDGANLMWRANTEKTLMLGKTENKTRKEWQRISSSSGWHHGLNGHEFEQTQGDSEGQGIRHAAIHGATNCWTQLSNWTIMYTKYFLLCLTQAWERTPNNNNNNNNKKKSRRDGEIGKYKLN